MKTLVYPSHGDLVGPISTHSIGHGMWWFFLQLNSRVDEGCECRNAKEMVFQTIETDCSIKFVYPDSDPKLCLA